MSVIISFMHISLSISSKVFSCWKWRETSSTTTLLLIHTCSHWWLPVVFVITSISRMRQAVLKWGVKPESHSCHHRTAARQSQQSESFVTRLLATEHIRKKYSLRESMHCKIVRLSLAPMFFDALLWTALNAINQINCTEKGGFITNT